MSARHTPGPWSWSPEAEDEDGEPAFFSIKTESGREVANTASGDFSTDIEIRNARLIAAAPDMLAALRRAVLALAFAAESSPAMRDDYEAVSAAIAKATRSES